MVSTMPFLFFGSFDINEVSSDDMLVNFGLWEVLGVLCEKKRLLKLDTKTSNYYN